MWSIRPYKLLWMSYRSINVLRQVHSYKPMIHLAAGKNYPSCCYRKLINTKQIWEFTSQKGFRPQTSFWHLLPPLYSQFVPAQSTESHRTHTIWWIDVLPQINTRRRSIQPRPQRAVFNSPSFHSAPYRNLVCSWNRSWYAKYVLMVDWRNKWAGCKVDKNVGKWNREQHSNPRWMSLLICVWPDSDTKQGTLPVDLPILIFYHTVLSLFIKHLFFPVDSVTCWQRLCN